MNAKKYIMANWKMNGSKPMIKAYIEQLEQHPTNESTQRVIFPPYVYLDQFNGSPVLYGGQNVSAEITGAYTGEISVAMLRECGCQYVLVGHSERRHIFKENDEFIAKKFHIVKEHGIIPVFCIGETLQQYEAGKTEKVLRSQIYSLKTADFSFKQCIIAYEPVWAIGTGLTPNQQEIAKVFANIKKIIWELTQETDIPLLYGGSVNEKNVPMINEIKDCSGVLVGGASLNVNQLLEIEKCITC
jgi:triosephosphate isomerase